MPDVPPHFAWPARGDLPLPFLLQIDFSEVNGDGALPDFPRSGVIAVFVDDADVNDPDFENGEDPYAQGKTFKILFFDGEDGYTPAQKLNALGKVYKQFHVAPETVKTYPDAEDCREANEIYCNRPVGGMDDEYDAFRCEHTDAACIGGWASYVQSSALPDRDAPDDEWVLLMQIPSYFGASWEDCILWGDAGIVYMFIRKSDLRARNFDAVKFDMQCT